MNDKEELTSPDESKTPNLFSTFNSAQKLIKAMGNIVPNYTASLKSASIVGENFGKRISEAMRNFVNVTNFYDVHRETIQASLDNISKIISGAFERIKIPYLSEEKKDELKNSYEQWGKFGWTIIPDSPLNFFFNAPISLEDANKKAEQYCKNENIALLFDELRAKKVNKKDLEEAIFCFENRKYKACSLMVFGIIDAKMIRKMPAPEKEGDWRPVGGKAVKALKEQFSDDEEGLYYLLSSINLFSCLTVMFERANDFKKEPEVINRNFIDHGMNKRPVRKRDCIQLFLLLNNFIDFFGK